MARTAEGYKAGLQLWVLHAQIGAFSGVSSSAIVWRLGVYIRYDDGLDRQTGWEAGRHGEHQALGHCYDPFPAWVDDY